MAIATYQVPSGSHQLVGGEGEGLIAQVSIKHILENGTAVNKDRVVSQRVTQTQASLARAREAVGALPTRRTANDVYLDNLVGTGHKCHHIRKPFLWTVWEARLQMSSALRRV